MARFNYGEILMITADDMQPGDVVEFLSDRQTDKGPSSGRCTSNDGTYITITHSDIEDDIFSAKVLEVDYCRNRPKFGNAYWALV